METLSAHYFNLDSKPTTQREEKWKMGFARTLTLYDVIPSSHMGPKLDPSFHLFGVWKITMKDCHYKCWYFQPAEGVRYAEGVEEISEDELNSIAEELTKEELEELEVCWTDFSAGLVFLSFLFSIHRWWGWPAIWKKNCDACCEWSCNSYWYYLFHKKILKYTYLRNLFCNISRSSPVIPII